MKYRAIGSLIGLILFLAITEPMLFAILSVFFIVGYLLVSRFLIPFLNSQNVDEVDTMRRKSALLKAKIFLSPYKDIWGDLKLSNKNCYLYLDKDGVTITGKEKNFPYRRFRILNSTVHSYRDLWNMFCLRYSHNTTYDGLIENCIKYHASIYEYATQTAKKNTPIVKNQNSKTIQLASDAEKLDINNCSEIELTSLPGVSIVMAKKAIKKREEIGGFKTIEDFCLFLKLKPHIETQLRDKIIAKKMKIAQKTKRNAERSVDL